MHQPVEFKPQSPGINWCECDEPDVQYGGLKEPGCKKCGGWIRPHSPVEG